MSRTRSGDERRAVAHHGGVLHEDALRQGLVRRQLDHVQPQLPQQPHVVLVLPLGLLQLDLAARPEGERDATHHGVSVPKSRHLARTYQRREPQRDCERGDR